MRKLAAVPRDSYPMVMFLTSVLGGGKGGSAAASLWLRNLLVLGLKLLCWEEVFFPVKADFGN